MSPMKNDDDWVFDTVRPATRQEVITPQSIKKRKLSSTQMPMPYSEPPAEMMERLDLNNDMPREAPEFTPLPTDTVRIVSRRQSVATPTMQRSPQRRDSIMAPPPQPRFTQSSSFVPPATGSNSRRQSVATMQRIRQPLAADTSFGNSPSAARPFRRVSGNAPTNAGRNEMDISTDESGMQQSSPFSENVENIPPAAPAQTKEAKLGRKLFAKVVDPAFQGTYAQTADSASREALARVGLAWSTLDAIDPEGGVAFLRSIVERLASDAKLSSALRPTPATPMSTPLSRAPSSRLSTPTPSPSKRATPGPRADRERAPHDRRQSASPVKPSKQHQQQRSPSKLVLAQSNPHLQSHARKRQSSAVSLVSAVAEKASSRPPSGLGRTPSSPSKSSDAGRTPKSPASRNPSNRSSMVSSSDVSRPAPQRRESAEHSRRIADALYGRWSDGVKGRV